MEKVMEHIAELGGIVTGFNVTEHCIDCMCGLGSRPLE